MRGGEPQKDDRIGTRSHAKIELQKEWLHSKPPYIGWINRAMQYNTQSPRPRGPYIGIDTAHQSTQHDMGLLLGALQRVRSRVVPKEPRTRWREKIPKEKNDSNATTTSTFRNGNLQIGNRWKTKINPPIMSHTQDQKSKRPNKSQQLSTYPTTAPVHVSAMDERA